MAFSGTTTFEKTFSIDDIITEAFERLGFFDYSGVNLLYCLQMIASKRRFSRPSLLTRRSVLVLNVGAWLG